MSEQKKSYYAIIPSDVRYDKSLCANAKLLYGEITALCNEKGYCWASNNYFSELYEVSKETVSRWISSLVKGEYITVKINRKESKEIESRYIYIGSFSKKSIPIDEKVNTPIDEKVKDNNTINNSVRGEKSPLEKQKKSSEFEKIETAYLDSFQELHSQGNVYTEKPIINYGAVRKRIKQIKSKYKLDDMQIINIIKKAMSEQWILSQGFSFMTILSDTQVNKLLNAKPQNNFGTFSNQPKKVDLSDKIRLGD